MLLLLTMIFLEIELADIETTLNGNAFFQSFFKWNYFYVGLSVGWVGSGMSIPRNYPLYFGYFTNEVIRIFINTKTKPKPELSILPITFYYTFI